MKPQKGQRQGSLRGLEASAHDRLRAFPRCDPAPAPPWSRSQPQNDESLASHACVLCSPHTGEIEAQSHHDTTR